MRKKIEWFDVERCVTCIYFRKDKEHKGYTGCYRFGGPCQDKKYEFYKENDAATTRRIEGKAW